MPTVREHVNKPVISTSDGRKLGKIRDLYLDPGLTRVTAVYLGRSGVLGRKKLMIERDQIRTCGMDAWLVDTPDVVVDPGLIVGSGLPGGAYRNLKPAPATGASSSPAEPRPGLLLARSRRFLGALPGSGQASSRPCCQ